MALVLEVEKAREACPKVLKERRGYFRRGGGTEGSEGAEGENEAGRLIRRDEVESTEVAGGADSGRGESSSHASSTSEEL